MARSAYRKICVIGDVSVGKTSLIRQFVFKQFCDTYVCTIGAQISQSPALPVLNSGAYDVKLLIWDLGGGNTQTEQYRTYLEGAAGAILVCDVSRLSTLEALPEYAQVFRQVNPQQPCVIVGNKSDLVQHRQDYLHLEMLAAQLNAPWYYSSAKTGSQVAHIFQALARQFSIVHS